MNKQGVGEKPPTPASFEQTEAYTPDAAVDTPNGNGYTPKALAEAPPITETSGAATSRVKRGLPWHPQDPKNPDRRWQSSGIGREAEEPDVQAEPQASNNGNSDQAEGTLHLSKGNQADLLLALGVLAEHGKEGCAPLSHGVQAAQRLLGIIGSQADETTWEMAQGSYYSSPR